MAARYHFLSDFRMTTDRDAVWTTLRAVEEWPTWWRWLKRIDVMREAMSEDGVGAVYRNHIGSPTGYAFDFQGEIVAADRLRRIDLTLTGEIVGRIRYLLSDDPSGGTHVEYAQLVETPHLALSASEGPIAGAPTQLVAAEQIAKAVDRHRVQSRACRPRRTPAVDSGVAAPDAARPARGPCRRRHLRVFEDQPELPPLERFERPSEVLPGHPSPVDDDVMWSVVFAPHQATRQVAASHDAVPARTVREVQMADALAEPSPRAIEQPVDVRLVRSEDLVVIPLAEGTPDLLRLRDDPGRRPPKPVRETVSPAIGAQELFVARGIRQDVARAGGRR